MKKILNVFSKEKVQKLLFLAMLVLVFGVFMFSIFKNDEIDKPNPDDPIVNPDDNQEGKPDDKKPEPEKFKAPCDTTTSSIIRHFYSIDDDSSTQEMSLIKIGTKYQMSRGLTFKREDDSTFDVQATLSGTVTSVVESPLYGYVITIDHGDNVKSEYLGVSKPVVKVNDTVKQGQVIASSGQAEYDEVASNHVHFRVSVEGKYVDPEDLFNKTK